MKLIKSKKLNVYVIPVKKPKTFFEGQGSFRFHITNYTNKPLELIFGNQECLVKNREVMVVDVMDHLNPIQLKLRFICDIKPIEGCVYMDVYEV